MTLQDVTKAKTNSSNDRQTTTVRHTERNSYEQLTAPTKDSTFNVTFSHKLHNTNGNYNNANQMYME